MKIYHKTTHANPESIQQAVRGGDAKTICEALVDASLTHDAVEGIQDVCVDLLRHDNPYVRQSAAIGLEHLARRFRTLDLSRVLPVLDVMRKTDAEFYGRGIADDSYNRITKLCGAG